MKLKRSYKSKSAAWLLSTLLASHKIICHRDPQTKSFQNACFQFDNSLAEILFRMGWDDARVWDFCEAHEATKDNLILTN